MTGGEKVEADPPVITEVPKIVIVIVNKTIKLKVLKRKSEIQIPKGS